MDAGTLTDPLLELSLRHAREQRQDMALWLAVELLMTDDMAVADEELQNCLISLQDRLEDKTRASYSLSQPDTEAWASALRKLAPGGRAGSAEYLPFVMILLGQLTSELADMRTGLTRLSATARVIKSIVEHEQLS